MPENVKTTTWWKVSGLNFTPTVEAVEAVAETEKTVTTVRRHYDTGELVRAKGALVTDKNLKVAERTRYFPEEGLAYLYALERAEQRQASLRAQLEKVNAAVAELGNQVLRIGEPEELVQPTQAGGAQ